MRNVFCSQEFDKILCPQSFEASSMSVVRRPLNRILIAQRIAAPQMVVSVAVAGLHVLANIFFIHTLGLGFLGAAYAICLASLNNTLLTAAYVLIAGMQDRVWGTPTWDAFKVRCFSILQQWLFSHTFLRHSTSVILFPVLCPVIKPWYCH